MNLHVEMHNRRWGWPRPLLIRLLVAVSLVATSGAGCGSGPSAAESAGASNVPAGSDMAPTASIPLGLTSAAPARHSPEASPTAVAGHAILPTAWSSASDTVVPGFGGESVLVVLAPDGGFLAVVPRNGPSSVVLRSVDGRSWSESGSLPADLGCPECGNAVPVWIAATSESIVVAGVDRSDLKPLAMASADGRAWTRVTDGLGDGPIADLVATPTGFLAVANDPPRILVGSADGRSWTGTDLPASEGAPSARLRAVAATSKGCVAVGSVDGNGAAWASLGDGEWRRVPVPDAKYAELRGLAAHGDRLIAFGPDLSVDLDGIAGQTRVWISDDSGATWRAGTGAPGLAGALAPEVVSTEAGFAAAGSASGLGTGTRIWISADGLVWAPASDDGTTRWSLASIHSIAASGTTAVIAGLDSREDASDPSGWRTVVRFWYASTWAADPPQ